MTTDAIKATTTTLSTTTPQIKREGRSRIKRSSSTKTFVQQRRRSLSHDDIHMLKHVQLEENVPNISRSNINKQRRHGQNHYKYQLIPSSSTNTKCKSSSNTSNHHENNNNNNNNNNHSSSTSSLTNRLINFKSFSSSVSLSSTRVWFSLRHISSLTSLGNSTSSYHHSTPPSSPTIRTNKSFSSSLSLQRTSSSSIDLQTKRLYSCVTKVLGMINKFQWSKLRKYIKHQKLKQQQQQSYFQIMIEECWKQSSLHLLLQQQQQEKEESFSCDSNDHHFGMNLLHMLCQGHPPVDIIEQFMYHCPFETNVIIEDCCHNEYHHTPLHIACMYGANIKVVEYLLNKASHVASWKDIEGKTPLHLHCECTCGIINTCDPHNYTKEQHYEYSNKVHDAILELPQQLNTAIITEDTGLFIQHEQNCSYITFGPVWNIIQLLYNSSSSCINEEDHYERNPIEYCLGITGANNTQQTKDRCNNTATTTTSTTSAMDYVISQYTKDIIKQIQELSIRQWSLHAAELRRKHQLELILQQREQQEEREHEQSLMNTTNTTYTGGSSQHSRRRSSNYNTNISRFSMTQRRRSLSIPSILTKSHAEQMVVESNGILQLFEAEQESSSSVYDNNDLEEPTQRRIDNEKKNHRFVMTTNFRTFSNNNNNNSNNINNNKKISDDSCNNDLYKNHCRDDDEEAVEEKQQQKQTIIIPSTTTIQRYSTTSTKEEEEKSNEERRRHGLLLMKQIQHCATDLISAV